MSIATVQTQLKHHVRLTHASTGTPIAGIAARLRPAAFGWSMRVAGPDVVVAARTDAPPLTVTPELAITVVDGVRADLLVIPTIPGELPNTVVVSLAAAEIDVPLHPVPMTMTVVLTTPSTGVPRSGRTVVARARSGPAPRPTINLPEVSPGIYTSAAVEWTSAFLPADLLVNTKLLRVFSIDLSTTKTRIHLVDTT
ncbi:MAG: hypothetical protein ACRDOM_10470 [Nocardioides sp.]